MKKLQRFTFVVDPYAGFARWSVGAAGLTAAWESVKDYIRWDKVLAIEIEDFD